MDILPRTIVFALNLALVVSMLGIFLPDPKSSPRGFGLGIGLIVITGMAVLFLMQAVVPTGTKSVGEDDEVVETHSLASLKSGSRIDGKMAFSFGYLTEKDEYVLMVRQDDGGYRKKCYPADNAVVYEDADGDDARVEVADCYQIVRSTYRLPIIGEWTSDRREFSKRETRIHVPEGSIAQGEYDVS